MKDWHKQLLRYNTTHLLYLSKQKNDCRMESLSLKAKLATLPEWRTGISSYLAQRQRQVQVTQ